MRNTGENLYIISYIDRPRHFSDRLRSTHNFSLKWLVLGTYHDDEIEQEWLVEQWLVELVEQCWTPGRLLLQWLVEQWLVELKSTKM